jgi:hypothetical protein
MQRLLGAAIGANRREIEGGYFALCE